LSIKKGLRIPFQSAFSAEVEREREERPGWKSRKGKEEREKRREKDP